MPREKQEIKQSEARILIYLSVVRNTRKGLSKIAHSLEMDYSYCMRVLQSMVAKKWVMKHPYRRNMFYDLTMLAPLELAKSLYNENNKMQEELNKYMNEGEEDEQTNEIRERESESDSGQPSERVYD